MDIVVAEGEPLDLAIYTHALLEVFRIKMEMEKHEREMSEKFSNMTIEELMKMERDEEE